MTTLILMHASLNPPSSLYISYWGHLGEPLADLDYTWSELCLIWYFSIFLANFILECFHLLNECLEKVRPALLAGSAMNRSTITASDGVAILLA